MRIGPQRPVNPDAIVAPQGYRVEALVTGLTFPSALTFGPGGELYLAESGGIAGNVYALPRVLRIDPDSSVHEIGRVDDPISSLLYRNGELLIGVDGPSTRILRVTAEYEVQILVEDLPGGGDYGLSGLSVGPDGSLLFGVGTRTNSGVVGLDNLARGWVARRPEAADVPGADLELAGVNYVTANPAAEGSGRATTGAFKPFGHRSEPGEKIKGSQRSGGSLYRLAADGKLERIAWGLRNPIGVSTSPDGRLFVTEGGMEERGSRPIAAAPDNLWEIQNGGYYGWPDYASGLPVTDARFRLPGHPPPRQLLQNGPRVTGTPRATFPARSGIGRLDFSRSEAFGFPGQAFVALSGEWSAAAFPGEDVAPGGFRVVRVDMRSGEVTDFLVNRNGAPASAGNTGGLERPFDVRFDPSGEILYVLDLGEIHLNRESGLEPFGGTGILWRITRARPAAPAAPPRERKQRQPAAEAVPAEEAGPEEAGPEEAGPEEAAAGEAAEGGREETTPAGEEAPAAEEPISEEPTPEELSTAEGIPTEPEAETPAAAELGEAGPTVERPMTPEAGAPAGQAAAGAEEAQEAQEAEEGEGAEPETAEEPREREQRGGPILENWE